MKKNNLKILATCLSLLISLLIFGCAQNNPSGSMGNTMENTMDEMKQPDMEKSMGTMQDQKMEEPIEKMDSTTDKMESDGMKDNMSGMEDKKMQPDKVKMMK